MLTTSLSQAPALQENYPISPVQKELELLRNQLVELVPGRPDLLVNKHLRTGVLFGKKLEEWPVLDEAKLSGEQKAVLPSAYYEDNGVPPDALAPRFGYPSGEAMIDHLVELQQKIQASGGREKLIEALVEARIMERLRLFRRALDKGSSI